MAAIAEGVDLENPAEYQAFITRYNERMFAGNQQRPRITELGVDDAYGPAIPYNRQGPKVGRNDPCTGGSGKKYKKCCGTG